MEAPKPPQRRKVKLEEEMMEIKQGLLLTVVICRICKGHRRVKVVNNRRGGIVAQLGDCPDCGASSGDQLSPMDDMSPHQRRTNPTLELPEGSIQRYQPSLQRTHQLPRR